VSQSASQAAAFYREVALAGAVWTIRDAGGFPAPKDSEGRRAQPFWSSRSRAEKVVATVAAYSSFSIVEIAWTEFSERWIPGLARDGILVGVNWSGARATGYDVEPAEVLANVTGLSNREDPLQASGVIVTPGSEE
jgi:hypothetical protein